MWYLAQFDLEIIHIKGENNYVADWLSRSAAYSSDHDTVIDEVAVPLVPALPVSSSVALPTVTELKEAIQQVSEKERSKCVVGADGLLYSRQMKLFIPHQFRNSVVYWLHAGPTGIHRGVNPTYRQLRRYMCYMWWPGMFNHVCVFVKACLVCLRNRSPKRSTSSMVLRRPSVFKLVSIDFVGPREVQGVEWYYVVVIDHCSRFIQTCSVRLRSTDAAVAIIKEQWVPTFGAPKVLLADNGSEFTSTQFVKYVTEDLMAHLVHSSPYYPQGNSINESSHNVLEHGIKCWLQRPHIETFPEILRNVTFGYNASYHSSIGDSPFSLMFGKPPVLPGWQGLSSEESELSRKYLLRHGELHRHLEAFLPKDSELVGVDEKGSNLKLNDFVVFPYGDYEKRQADSGSEMSPKYTPLWSLPSRVIRVGTKQVQVVEYGTGRLRKVPFAQCRKLPTDIPSGLKELNWTHIHHHLPKRWRAPIKSTDLPEIYRDLLGSSDYFTSRVLVETPQSSEVVSITPKAKKRRIPPNQEER